MSKGYCIYPLGPQYIDLENGFNYHFLVTYFMAPCLEVSFNCDDLSYYLAYMYMYSYLQVIRQRSTPAGYEQKGCIERFKSLSNGNEVLIEAKLGVAENGWEVHFNLANEDGIKVSGNVAGLTFVTLKQG